MTRISKFLYPENIARCQHIKTNGVQCGSPALKSRAYCHFHYEFHLAGLTPRRGRPPQNNDFLFNAPLEDANSIQLALMRVMHLLYTGKLDTKRASLLLYALQTASANLRIADFEPEPDDVVIDKSQVWNTSLGDPAWFPEEFEDDEDDEDEEEDGNEEPRAQSAPSEAATTGNQEQEQVESIVDDQDEDEDDAENEDQNEPAAAAALKHDAREARLDAAAEKREKKWLERRMREVEEDERKREKNMQSAREARAKWQAEQAAAQQAASASDDERPSTGDSEDGLTIHACIDEAWVQ